MHSNVLNTKAKHTVHWNAYLCCLDVTVHLVVQLAHLELQQREREDMSFRNKACSEATAEVPDSCGLDQSQHTECEGDSDTTTTCTGIEISYWCTWQV